MFFHIFMYMYYSLHFLLYFSLPHCPSFLVLYLHHNNIIWWYNKVWHSKHTINYSLSLKLHFLLSIVHNCSCYSFGWHCFFIFIYKSCNDEIYGWNIPSWFFYLGFLGNWSQWVCQSVLLALARHDYQNVLNTGPILPEYFLIGILGWFPWSPLLLKINWSDFSIYSECNDHNSLWIQCFSCGLLQQFCFVLGWSFL